jgi:hypothetical protein
MVAGAVIEAGSNEAFAELNVFEQAPFRVG